MAHHPEYRYVDGSYEHLESTLADAREIVPEILRLIRPGSVIDLGCGIGTWLSVFRELGVTESRVSQMRAEALSLIGEAMTTHLGDTPSEQPVGVAARRRAAYAAAVGTASDFRSRLDLVSAPSSAVASA